MADRRGSKAWTCGVVVAVALTTAGLGLGLGPGADPARAQDPAPADKAPDKAPEKDKTKAPRGRAGSRSRRRTVPAPAAPPKADATGKRAANPFNKAADPDDTESMHYALKLNGADNKPLAASYYPSKKGTSAPVVLLIHERSRSAKDFEEPIADLKRKGLAQALQAEEYAVMTLDLRGHGANPRRDITPREWRAMIEDLQSAYLFLLDRHNHGELNLARLGVVAVGEGANLAATWAASAGGAVSSEGRTSDLGALILISPMGDEASQGLRLGPPIASIAPRLPLLVQAGERDTATMAALTASRPVIERSRVNKVETYPTSLHGYRLLWLEPKAAGAVVKFLDSTIKFKTEDWEPRYNLEPVAYNDVFAVTKANTPAPATKKAADPAKKAAAEPAAKKAP
jgi:pimeloyl-ACP methyl ester carboxylesterase